MTATRSGPPIAPVIHRSLVTGLLMLTGVMVVLKSGGMASSAQNQIAGYVLSALSLVLLTVAVLFLKPRVPERRPRQPIEEYWSAAGPTVLPMWCVMEAAGISAIAAYFLSEQTLAALAIGVSIAAFIWFGPRAFADA